MMQNNKLAMARSHHQSLRFHLFPGDGLEAAAIILCGQAGKNAGRLCVEEIIPVPYEACLRRTGDSISWPGEYLEKAIERAENSSASIILMHSHPSGLLEFSEIDDASDARVIPCLHHGLNEPEISHGSAIMVADGTIKARLYDNNMRANPVGQVISVGSEIINLSSPVRPPILPFTAAMTQRLSETSVCVIGVSGTGSIVVEILARLGVGKLILIDFDRVEIKNLNRILNTTLDDAHQRVFKTRMKSAAISKYRSNVEVVTIEQAIGDPAAIFAAGDADVLFSCVDNIEGRHYCDLIASAFVLPLIDIGVSIPTRIASDGGHAIADVCGRIDYVHPGGSSLADRGVVTPEGLRREYLRAVAPDDLKSQIEAGYLIGIQDEAPSVISLNMRAASAGVNEWLARLFDIRIDSNENYARTLFSLAACEEEYFSEASFTATASPILGRGQRVPLLGIPALLEVKKSAA